MKKSYIKTIVVFLIILAVIGGIAGNYIYSKNKIERANKSAYQFLKCVEICPIQYNINVVTKKVVSDFESECLNNCLMFLREVEFKTGEIKSDDLILESESYKACVSVKQVEGVEEYKNCIGDLIPQIEERYPEVLK